MEQIKILKKINEYPLPLPAIYLTPYTDVIDSGEEELVYPNEVGFPISLPYKTIIEKHYDFIDLGRSGGFFNQLREKLLVCQDIEEIRSILEENIQSQGTIDKIDRFFSELFRQKILDVNTGIPSVWTVKDKYNDMEFN